MHLLIAIGLLFLLGFIWWLVFRVCMRDPNTRNGLSGNGFSEDGLPPGGALP
jgi:hypothetical protein